MDAPGQDPAYIFAVAAMNGPSSRPAALRVLVADDDAGIRELLRDVLLAEGYEVDEAANGAEALARARSNPPAAAKISPRQRSKLSSTVIAASGPTSWDFQS